MLFKKRAVVGLLALGSLIPLTFAGSVVAAGPASIGLGTSDSYGVLAGDMITNTGATSITGDLGLHAGTSVTGAPTVSGASNVANGAALQAKNDLRTADPRRRGTLRPDSHRCGCARRQNARAGSLQGRRSSLPPSASPRVRR